MTEKTMEQLFAEVTQLRRQLDDETTTKIRLMKESEIRLRAFFDMSPCGILLIDKNTNLITHANPTLHRILKYDKEELEGLSIEEIGQRLSDIFSEAKSYQQSAERVELQTKCGETIKCIVYYSVVWLTNSNAFSTKDTDRMDLKTNKLCILAFIQDAQQMVNLENQIIKAQKLEAIGTLSAAVIHDFNNIMAAIRGNAEMTLEEKKELDEDTQDALHIIKQSSDEGCRLLKELLAFTKRERPYSWVNIDNIISEVTHVIGKFGKRIFQVHMTRRGNFVLGDTVRLRQVFMNLCLNAVQATDRDKGHILVSTTNIQTDEVNNLIIRVQDNGCGIAPENIDQIFNPFYTTKEEGNGLGLSTSRAIIETHGGILKVRSTVGKGTTFTIVLPTR